MQGDLTYYSERKASTGPGDMEFFGFVPRQGPNGGRVVIDGFRVVVEWDIDVATAAAEGEDFARLFGNVQVVQRDGLVRWNLSGDRTRAACFALLGPQRMTDNADTGSSENDLTGRTELYVPMSKPWVHTEDDTALPVDNFAKVIIAGVTLATVLDIGSSAVTVNSLTYFVIADCHEDLDLQFYCVDVVKADLHTSTSETVISVGGKVHDLLLHATGAGGGASLSNLTNVRIDEPAGMLQTMTRLELESKYRYKRLAGASSATVGGERYSDPFVNDKACAVILSDKRTSSWSGAYAERLKLNLSNSVSSIYSITRTMKPRSIESMNQIAAQYGVNRIEQITVKTDKKSKRTLGEWPRHLWPYLRFKAPLSASR